jgi:type I restriction enzyme S subunit
MSDAIETTLGEVLEIKYGKDHKKLADGNIPLYGSGGIMRYVEKALYNKPSILIPRKGSLDNLFYEENPFWTVDTLFWTKIDENQVDPKYLFYLLSLYKLSKYDEGSAVPSLTTKALNDVPIAFPRDKNEQIAIRKIIDNLDKKITLLRQQNQDLEELAQTLFKRWFVEFEFPNENGEPYLSTGGKMVESELGEIPEGWRVVQLQDITNRVCVGFVGTCHKYYCEKENGIPLIRTGDLSSFGINFDNTIYVTKEFHEKNKKSQLKYGDILIARHGENGLPSIYNKNHPANCLNVVIIKPNHDSNFSTEFIYLGFTSKHIIHQIKSAIVGSVQGVVNTRTIAEVNLATPVKDTPLLVNFNNIANDIFHKISINQEEIQTLTQLRDTLLPKLMSGELRVNS